MAKAIYPRLKENQKLSKKLTEDEIVEIKKLYNDGMSAPKIAKEYGITKAAVYYHTNPNVKAAHLRNSSNRQKELWETDPNFKEQKRKQMKDFYNKHKKRLNDYSRKIKAIQRKEAVK